MDDIRIYRYDGTLLMTVSKYVHLSWENCLTDAGLVTLTLTTPHGISDLLEKEPYVLLNWRGMFATVESVRYAESFIKVQARALTVLLARRIIPKDKFSISGTGEACVRAVLEEYAPFLAIAPHTDRLPEKDFVFQEPTDLLTAVKTFLAGSGLGICIAFDKGIFTFEFVEKRQTTVRISTDNRNVHNVVCDIPYNGVQNACYCLEAFFPVENVDAGDGLKDGDPDNYMHQYYLTEAIEFEDIFYEKGVYLYCDTLDGKLKWANGPKDVIERYVTFTENPLAVFEQDFRNLSRAEAEAILALRRYPVEDWSVKPENITLSLGDMVSAEKTVGLEKGLKSLQVRRILYDTALPQPIISLSPLEE
ncbi:MAG: hypothetical protein IJE10_09010 [Clostridia bacterium]|nr:hypothetical protein [Clostridia bacterium]